MIKIALPQKWISILSMIPLVLLAGFVITCFAPASPVFADTIPTPTPRFPKVDEHVNQVLANQLKREQNWLTIQQNHLDRANQGIRKAQELIDTAKNEGKDVTDLETGLNIFRAKIANAQSDHVTAAGILSAHTGFDPNGTVIDRDTAHKTVIDARQSLENAHHTIDQALRDFSQVVKDWKRDHNQQAIPTPTPAS
jgi:predicted DNA binding protein